MLTESDLNTIKGLLHYLNDGQLRDGDLRLDEAGIVNSNGDRIASILYEDGQYGIIVP